MSAKEAGKTTIARLESTVRDREMEIANLRERVQQGSNSALAWQREANEAKAQLASQIPTVRREAAAWKTVAEQQRREITALRFDLAMAGVPQGYGGESEGVRPAR